MKHRRIAALILALALSVGLLATCALAADTDAQSQATPKGAQEDGQLMKPETRDDAQSGEAREKQRTRGAKKEEASEPEGAVGKQAAKEAALADAGLTADEVSRIRARVSEQDGAVVYKVRFTFDGQKYSYRIDALSGQVLDKTVGADTGKTHGARRARTQEAAEGQVSDA